MSTGKLLLLMLVACDIPRAPRLAFHDNDPMEQLARAVDKLQWYVDAYGGASMSSPLLVQPDDAFKFNLSVTADQYFAAERDQISGREAGSVASAQVFGANAAGSVDLAAMQSYAQALADYRHDRATANAKQQILNDAAYRQYYAAMIAASQISDKSARASAEADAAKQYAGALSGPAADATLTPPTPPSAPALPTLATPTNAAAALLPAISAPQGLYASGTPGVTGETRTATLMAAGDVATAAMLSTLLDPNKLSSFAGRQVLWGVSMVAVTPGWKTRKGYSATLEGDVDYAWRWARPEVRAAFIAQVSKSPGDAHALSELQRCVVDSMPYEHPLENPESLCSKQRGHVCAVDAPFDGAAYGPWIYKSNLWDAPVVAAASPMGDAQALDLQASSRSVRQTALQMAFALSAAGYGGQAAAFLNFARSNQLDVETRTNNVVVSAFSSVGGNFGFQFNPRVVADPKVGAAGEVLQVPTFPTLLIIGMNSNEMHARVLVQNGRCFVVEPQLRLHTGVRWSQTSEQCTHRFQRESPCREHELTEEELYVAANDAEDLLEKTEDDSASWSRLSHRLEHLENNFGSKQGLWVPVDVVVPGPDKPKKASVTVAAPTSIDLAYNAGGTLDAAPVTMTVAGSNLDLVDTTGVKGVDGVTATANKNGTLDLKFTVSKPGIYVFVLPLKDGGALATPPFTVRAPNVYVVSHTAGEKDGVTTDTLSATPGTPPDVIKSEIEKKKILPADVKLEVDTHTSAKGAK